MEILSKNTGDAVELTIRGRLDAYWADLLAAELEKVIHEGQHFLRLDLGEVSFLSSAGIGVMLKYYKAVKKIGGRLRIVRMSDPVRRVLELSRLTELLAPPDGDMPQAADAITGRTLRHPTMQATVFAGKANGVLAARVLGDPGRLVSGMYRADDCQLVRFPAGTLGLGLGALGTAYEECRGSFGEFLAVGGAAAYMPTHPTPAPDFLLGTADLVPEMVLCYGLAAEGDFAHRARFEPLPPASTVSLTDLAELALHLAGTEAAGLVFMAEAASLMGATLRQPPTQPRPAGGMFAFPQVRDWLTFTAERAFPHSSVLGVGVAARGDGGGLAPMLRPLGSKSSLAAHFHAAAFSYRPMPKNPLDVPSAVHQLFTGHSLLGILHLLVDDRPIMGAGQSEFLRGTVWVSPLRPAGPEGVSP